MHPSYHKPSLPATKLRAALALDAPPPKRFEGAMAEPKPLTRAERTIAARKAREAEALRQNLLKRKAQARAKPAKPEGGDQNHAGNA